MRRRSSSLALAAVAAGALALAGCGSGSSGQSVPKDPKGELAASVSNLGDSDTLTSTIKLDIAPADLQQLAKADGAVINPRKTKALKSATNDRTWSLMRASEYKSLTLDVPA